MNHEIIEKSFNELGDNLEKITDNVGLNLQLSLSPSGELKLFVQAKDLQEYENFVSTETLDLTDKGFSLKELLNGTVRCHKWADVGIDPSIIKFSIFFCFA